MQWISSLIKSLFRRTKVERALDDELNACRAILADGQMNRGADAAEARRQAAVGLGGVEQIKEQVRETMAGRGIRNMAQDIRYAIRQLWWSPGFTIVAALTLSVAIGATTAIFAQLNAVFFKRLPLHNPEELRRIAWNSPKRGFAGGVEDVKPGGDPFPVEFFSYSAFLSIRDGSKSVADLACWQLWSNLPIVLQELGPVETQFVSGNYFKTLGVNVALGRTLTLDDDRPSGKSTVAMVSYALWQRRGGDPGILNQALHANGMTLTVIGVRARRRNRREPKPRLYCASLFLRILQMSRMNCLPFRCWTFPEGPIRCVARYRVRFVS